MNEPDNKNTVDLTGSQTVEVEEDVTPEDFGKAEAETSKDITIEDAGTDHAGLALAEYRAQQTVTAEKPVKVYPVETTIEYLFNPNNKKIFPVNEDIVKQKGLVPCTKEGKLLPDTRRPSEFR